MKQIEVYDLDFEEITNICEDNNIDECEVIEAMLDAIRDKKIDITEWLQGVQTIRMLCRIQQSIKDRNKITSRRAAAKPPERQANKV